MDNQWVQSGNNFFIREVSNNVKAIPPAIYKIESTPQGELYLAQVQDIYEFPYKVYGIETKFIERISKTYDNTTGNLGVLLNGVKGTGKTVTAKQICNNFIKQGMPVIIVHYKFEGIPNFINDIQQNVVILVDEFEKIYPERDHSVLTIMDGAMDNGFRKVFLLTTNELYVSQNMIQRPGRIRYLKTYKDLSRTAIMEIVDDKLIHPELRDVTVEFISRLETITVDIVKAVVDEVNIHNENPNDFKDIFNIKMLENRYNLYLIKPGVAGDELVKSSVNVYPYKFDENCLGMDFELDGYEYGEIVEVLNENIIAVSDYDKDEEKQKITHYRVEKVVQYHYAF